MSKYIFVDIETTGLDAEEGAILEIAAAAVEEDINNMVGTFYALVETPKPLYTYEMDAFVLDMHAKTGLFLDHGYGIKNGIPCPLPGARPATVPVTQVEARFCQFLEQHGPQPLFVGNSLGSLDLPFLRKHMPTVFDYVHYRHIDISGLRESFRWVRGVDLKFNKEGKIKEWSLAKHESNIRNTNEQFQDKVRAKFNPDTAPLLVHGHRAATDVRLCYEEAKYLFDCFGWM